MNKSKECSKTPSKSLRISDREDLRNRLTALRYRIVNERSTIELTKLAKDASELMSEAVSMLEQPIANAPELLTGMALLLGSVVKTSVIKGREFCVSDTEEFDVAIRVLRGLFPMERSDIQSNDRNRRANDER